MAQINVGAAIGSGFGLIRRKPLSVLAWGLVPVLVQVLALLLLAPMIISTISQSVSAAASGATPAGPTSQVFAMEGLAQVVNLAQLLLSAVIYCAVWRAVLQPQRSAFAYMRIGIPELLFALLAFGASMAFGFAVMIAAIPAGIIGGIAGGVTQSWVVGVAVGVPIFLAIIAILAVLVGLRFSFVGPMMVADNKFRFSESWTLTKGRVGSLFMIGLGVFFVFLLIEVVIAAIFLGVGAALIAPYGGLTQFADALRASPQTILTTLWPFLAIYLVLVIPVAGCFTAIGAAPWAKAYQDLAADPTVATFA